jgi:hypothetical protein
MRKVAFRGVKSYFLILAMTLLQLAEYAAVATGLYVVEPFTVVAYPTVGACLHAF